MGQLLTEVLGRIVTMLGWDGTDFYAFRVDASGHLQVDVLSSALPAGAATEANQATLLDRFPNSAFRFKARYVQRVQKLGIAAGNQTLNGTTVPAGEVWIVTAGLAFNDISGNSQIYIGASDGTTDYIADRRVSTAADDVVKLSGAMYLAPGDHAKAIFSGCTAGDNICLCLFGYKMSV